MARTNLLELLELVELLRFPASADGVRPGSSWWGVRRGVDGPEQLEHARALLIGRESLLAHSG